MEEDHGWALSRGDVMQGHVTEIGKVVMQGRVHRPNLRVGERPVATMLLSRLTDKPPLNSRDQLQRLRRQRSLLRALRSVIELIERRETNECRG